MSNPFLILHKVRGEPAFDIATRCDEMGTESDPGPWWIIPTSGHRAYPVESWKLNELYWLGQMGPDGDDLNYDMATYPKLVLPDSWPDHYPLNRSPDTPKITAQDLLRNLNLPTVPLVTRRI